MKVVLHHLELVDYTTNTDKFYKAFVTPIGVLFHYGRNGTNGQERWQRCGSFDSASILANKKIYQKLDDGYRRPIDPVTYELEWVDSGVPLGPTSRAFMNGLKKIARTLDINLILESDVADFLPEGADSTEEEAREQAESGGDLKSSANDLASMAEEFSGQVVELITIIRQGDVHTSATRRNLHINVVMDDIVRLEDDLRRTEDALGRARMGLELARKGIGQKVTQ